MVLRVPRGSSLLRPEALSGHTGLPGRMLSWEGTDESLAWTVRLRHHKVIEWTVAYVAAGFARQGGLKVTPVSVTLMDFGARSIGFAALLAILVCAVTFTVPG